MGAFFGLSDRVTGLGWVALALICGGVLTIGLSAPTRRGAEWSLITGFLIATYVTIDGAGVRRTSDTLAYTAALFIMTAILLVPFALVLRGRAVVGLAVKAEWKRQLLAGVASLGSYSLLLYASRSAPLSLVSAARESGVLFATLLGWWFLDERVSRLRLAGRGVDRSGGGPVGTQPMTEPSARAPAAVRYPAQMRPAANSRDIANAAPSPIARPVPPQAAASVPARIRPLPHTTLRFLFQKRTS